jgi:hypothetical protein
MEKLADELKWLKRPSLEISTILYLAYDLDPLQWQKVSLPPLLKGEMTAVYRDIKAAIQREELDAKLHGNDVDWLANTLMTDFAPFVEARAKLQFLCSLLQLKTC